MAMLDVGLCNSTVMSAGLLELIELAARHGFPTITVIPARFAEAAEQGHDERAIRRRLRDAGVRVTQVDSLTGTLPGAPPLDYGDERLRAIYPRDVFFPPDEETCLRAAETLEADYLNITHFGGKPFPLEQIAEAVGALCRRAAARGLGISLECVPNTGLPDLAAGRVVLEQCGEPNFGLAIDPWHLVRSGETVADVARLPSGVVTLVQLCDLVPSLLGAARGPMTGRSLPGEGELPLFELADAVRAGSPNATFAIEWFSAETQRKTNEQIAARVARATRAWQSDYERGCGD